MREARLPWGMMTDGRMISVETVESGLACECVCPACKRQLIAAKGDIYRHHFRHHADQVECAHGGETALHLYAKQIICETLQLDYPRVHVGYKDHSFPAALGSMKAAAQEVDLLDSGIRADVFAEYEKEEIAVEILVAHAVGVEKVRRFAFYGIAAMEIDLSLYRHAQKSEAEWREAVLFGAPRYWLYPPKMVRDAEDMLRRAWIEEQRAKEQMARAIHLKLDEERLHALTVLAELTARKAALSEQQAIVLEAQRREKAAAEAALDRFEKVKAAEEKLKYAGMSAAVKQQRDREQSTPNLQMLVQAHGGYDRIPSEAWEDHEHATTRWLDQVYGRSPMFIDPPNLYRRFDPDRHGNKACVVCSQRAAFGYHQNGEMKWFCPDHRLASWWADARQ